MKSINFNKRLHLSYVYKLFSLSIGILFIFHSTRAQPIVSIPTVSNITNTTANLGGTIATATNLSERGTVWKTSSPVALTDNKLAEGGTSLGAYFHTRSSLPAKTLIYFAPYGTDDGGSALGPESSFYTLGNNPGAIANFSSDTQTSTSINLLWDASTNATGYLVYQASGATAPSPTLTDGAAPTGSPVANLVALTTNVIGLTRNTEYSFTVIPYDWDGVNAATYNYGTPKTLTSVFTLLETPTVTTPTSTTITSSGATLGGNITDDGGGTLTERGIYWSTTTGVTTADTKEAGAGTATGTFSDVVSTMTAKTHIFFKAYASNASFTGLSSESSFYTLGNDPGVIANFSSDTQTSTSINLLWDASTNAAGYLIYQATGATAPSPTLTDGAAPTGSPVANLTTLTTNITSLTRNTEYSFTVIPYDWDGVNAATYNYGTPKTLTSVFTLLETPTVTTPSIATITSSGATLGGTITDDGGGTLTERGIYWSTTTGVTTADTKEVGAGTATGAFSDIVSTMAAKTQIFFKAYASNASFTGLSSESSFYTLGNDPGAIASFSSTGQTPTSIDLGWTTSSNATGYLIYQATGSTAPTPTLTDGSAPTGSPVANVAILTTTISSLTAATEYSYTLIPYDWDGANTATYNYGTPKTLTSVFTPCLAPGTQASGLSISNINAGTVQINWTPGNGNGTLILVKSGSAVNVAPTDGTSYTADLDFTLGQDIGSGNIAVYDGHTSPQTITGLDPSTTYYFALYEYNTVDNCYLFTSPPTTNATTTAANNTSIIYNGTGAVSISSIADTDPEQVAVFNFTMKDLGDDGTDTEFTQIVFTEGPGDQIADWSTVIAGAKLYHNEQSGAEHGTAVIGANTITIPTINSSNNRLGEIDDGETKTYQLKIFLKNNLGSLKSTIDGLHLAFAIDESSFTYVANRGHFDPLTGTDSNADTGGANDNNPISVVATKIVYTTEPSTSATATVPLAQQPILEARDVNDNVDLDFAESIAVTTPDATLTPNSAPSAFSGGTVDFTGSGFNLQTTGTSILRVTSSPSNLVANSASSITVTASTTVAQVTGGIAASPLNSSSTNQALLGFSLTTSGSTLNFTGATITTSSDPDGKIKNIRLFRSTDASFATTGDNTLVTATITTPTASTITIASANESINSTTSYFFLVADVEDNVFTSTPALQLSIANVNDIIVSTGSMIGSSFAGTNYTFVDVTPPTILSVTAQTDPVYDGALSQTIVVVFSESMNNATSPALSFASSTNFSAGLGVWSSTSFTNDTWTQTFTHNGTAEEIASETVNLTSPSGVTDVAGNSDTGGGISNGFKVDTKNPTAVVTISTNPIIVSSPTQTVTVTYDEAMNPATQPTITFATSTDFTSNSDGVWSVGNTVWTESFTHGSVAEEVFETAVVASSSGATDVAGNTDIGDTSPSFTIDTKGPVITSITSTTTSGIYTTSTVITIIVNFDENTIVTGSPYLELNTTASVGQATYTSGSGTASLVFTYTVGTNENASPLDVTAVNLNGGSLKDAVSNNADLTLPGSPNRLQDNKTIQIDTKQPQIINVTSAASGYYNDDTNGNGNVIDIQVIFDEPVTITGTPLLTLNSGGTASYVVTATGTIQNFTYTVGPTDNANPLDYVDINSLSLNGGAIKDVVNLDAILTLPTVGGGNSIQDSNTIIIDTNEPIVSVLSPADDSFNNAINSNLVIQFGEDIALTTTGIITIYDDKLGVAAFTYDLSLLPTEVTQTQTNEITINPAANLNQNTSYHILIDGTAVLDLAGNQYVGIINNTDWNFVTFGPPVINLAANQGACIGDNLIIPGEFFTGVTEVKFGGSIGVVSLSFTVDSDNQITAQVPSTALSGTIYMTKQIGLSNPGGTPANPSTETGESLNSLTVGPYAATFALSGTTNVCDQGNTSTNFKVDISGDLSLLYNLVLQDNFANNYNISNYTSGNDFGIIPIGLNPTTYTFSLVSVTVASGPTAGCSISGGAINTPSSTDVTVKEQTVMDVGVDETYCLTSATPIVLNGQSITGTVTTGTWSVISGTESIVNPTNFANAEYSPSISDAFNGFVRFQFESDPNAPCTVVAQSKDFNFVSKGSVYAGDDVFVCIGSTSITLTGELLGGAPSAHWSTASNDSTQNTGFSVKQISPGNLTTTYTFPTQPLVSGDVYTLYLYADSGGGCDPEPLPDEIQITVAQPTNLQKDEASSDMFPCANTIGHYYLDLGNTTAGSTYGWTVTGGSIQTINPDTTNNIEVLWDQGPGLKTVEVYETRAIDGCVSSTLMFNVDVQPLPTVSLKSPTSNTFAQTDNRQQLIGNNFNDHANELFTGEGVVKDNTDGEYYFYPSLAANGTFDVTYYYTDPIGCTNSIITPFVVYNLSDPIIDSSTNFALADEFCEDEPARTVELSITVANNIASDRRFYEFTGPGITNSDSVNKTATFTPIDAAAGIEGDIQIVVWTISKTNDPSTIQSFGRKTVSMHLLPVLGATPIDNIICDGDASFELTRDAVLNPGTAGVDFRFFLEGDNNTADDDLTTNLVIKNGEKYFLNPANVGFDPNTYTVDPITVNINYTFQNSFGCNDTTTFTVDFYQTPPTPIADNTNICITDINNIPTVSVTNQVSAVSSSSGLIEVAEIEWYNNANRIGTPLGRDVTFTPTLAQLAGTQTDFYAFQVNDHCASPAVKVTYEQFTDISIDPASNCLSTNDFIINVNGDLTDVNSIAWTIEKSDGQLLLDHDSRLTASSYSFPEISSADLYTITATIESINGCQSDITRDIITLQTVTVDDSNFYTEDFEADNGQWVAENVSDSTNWQWGVPSGLTINSSQLGQNVWMTGLTNGYKAKSETNLYSACFDISGLSRPMVSLDTWYNTNADDGAIIEFTSSNTLNNASWNMLGTLNSGDQWYNAQSITANPGNQVTGQYGWSGNALTGWLSSKHVLEGTNMDPNNVIIRIQFKSESQRDLDGFAIDNLRIGNRTRTVLLENFTSSQQANNTLVQNQKIDDLTATTSSLMAIQYHPDINGNDPVGNTTEANARALYYGISTTPRVALDGEADPDQLFDQWAETSYKVQSLNIAPLDINTTVTSSNNKLLISSTITALDDIKANYVVHTVVIKNTVLDSDLGGVNIPSGESQFNNVVMKMLPTSSGKKFTADLLKGSSITVENAYTSNQTLNAGDYTIVVFVQDEATKRIHQTAVVTPTVNIITAIQKELEEKGVAIYPNPANEHLTLQVKQVVIKDTPVYIFNDLGQLVETTQINRGNDRVQINAVDWTPGFYYLQTELGDNQVRERVMIQHK